MRGFVNLNKPIGMTSSDAVVKVRGILKRATGEKVKVGHMGTLDPQASGVLPIAIGNATRLFDFMLDKTKTYLADFMFGTETDTLDGAGKILSTSNVNVSEEDVLSVIPELVGRVEQIPPQFSAKSVGGKRAYDMARAGEYAPLSAKTVDIYDIALVGKKADNVYNFKIVCGGGTYIRAIARDMAHALGTVGFMSSLVREQSGNFKLSDSVSLDAFEASPVDFVLPVDVALDGVEYVDLSGREAEFALNGVAIDCQKDNSIFAVRIDGETFALAICRDGKLKLTARL